MINADAALGDDDVVITITNDIPLAAAAIEPIGVIFTRAQKLPAEVQGLPYPSVVVFADAGTDAVEITDVICQNAGTSAGASGSNRPTFFLPPPPPSTLPALALAA